jgi:uncharacterized protein (DUF302 family)
VAQAGGRSHLTDAVPCPLLHADNGERRASTAAEGCGDTGPEPQEKAMTENSFSITREGTGHQDDTITKLSPRSVGATVSRLTSMITAKGMRLFAVIDQAAEARQAGLTLRDTVLVIFGNPGAGTLVMDAAPLAALDLPLKVLVWADGAQTKVSYCAPAALAARHQLSAGLAVKLAGIDPLTDALIAP